MRLANARTHSETIQITEICRGFFFQMPQLSCRKWPLVFIIILFSSPVVLGRKKMNEKQKLKILEDWAGRHWHAGW
jgi:hypothetical protein